MNKLLAASAATLIVIVAQASAIAAATPKQDLVTTCSADADARQLSAQEKSRFVSTCVSEGRKRDKQAQKACSEAAAYKQPHERKKFMAECVKG